MPADLTDYIGKEAILTFSDGNTGIGKVIGEHNQLFLKEGLIFTKENMKFIYGKEDLILTYKQNKKVKRINEASATRFKLVKKAFNFLFQHNLQDYQIFSNQVVTVRTI